MTDRLAQVRQHGVDPIAVSTLQPGLSYFETPEGYVAYQRAFGVALSLGGPICAPQHKLALARRFLAEVPGAALFYVDEALAQGVGGLSFRTALGTDRVLDLTRPDTFASAPCRSAMRKATKAGFTLEVLPATFSAEDRAFLERVTASALERSVVPYEMRFLNRPMDCEASGVSRVFALALRGKRFGYAVIDPCFEDGKLKGYLMNLLRFEQTSLWGVYLVAVQAISQVLSSEGTSTLSLGFCPLAKLDLEATSPLMRPQLRWMEKKYASLDYLTRLFQMKRELEGAWASRWLVTRRPELLTPVLALLELTGVPVVQIAREHLAQSLAA